MSRVFSALLFTVLFGGLAVRADVDVTLAHTGRVYDAATDRVFCLTGGSITPVNPATGAVEAPIVVTTTSSLSQMALSASGSQLFVRHGSDQRLAQVDLVSRAVVADWSAGTSGNAARTFYSFAALPGMPQRVVTATTQGGGNVFEVYENGVLLASTAQPSSLRLLVPGNQNGEWFALQSQLSSPCLMQRMQFTGSAISQAVPMGGFPTPNGSSIFQRKGRLLLIDVYWFDANTLLPNGAKYNYATGWDYDEASQRLVLAVGNSSSEERVIAMDARTMAAVEERDPPEPGNSDIVLCGDRLALCKADGIRFRDWRMVPKADEADLVVCQMPGPSFLTPGQPVSFSVLVRNAGRATAAGTQLTWSGISVTSANQVTTTVGSVQVSGGNVSVNLGDLPPDRQATVTIQIPSQPSGSPVITAAGTCSTTESSTANNSHALSLGSLGHGYGNWMAQQFSRNLATLYDKAGRRFFSLLGDSASHGNGWDGRVSFWAGQVMEMLPEQKRIAAFHALPAMGGCIAVKDGRLHAGLANRGTLVSKTLTSPAWETPVQIGTNAIGVPWQPISLAVAEGTAAETLLVARRDTQNGVPITLAAIQGGSMLPLTGAACDQVISAGPGRVAATRFEGFQTTKFLPHSLGVFGLEQRGEQTLSGDLSGVMHYAADTCFYHKYRISMLSGVASVLFGTAPQFLTPQPEGAVPDPLLNRFYWLDAYPGKLTTDAISPSTGRVQKDWVQGSERGANYLGTFRWGDYGMATASYSELVLSEHAGFIPPPPLTVTLPAVVVENAGTQVGAGMVSIPRPESSALTVNLVSSAISTLTVPASVTIPAGALSVGFDLTPIADAALTGPRKVTVTGSATNFTTTTANISVGDAQSTPITLTAPVTLAENAGYLSNAGSVSIGQALPMPLEVLVSSSHAAALGINFSDTPSSVVTIPAGQTTASFHLLVNDNELLDGDKLLTLTASVPGWPAASSALSIVDNESPVLSFSSDPFDRREQAGSGGGIRIYFGGQLIAPLTLTLQSSDETELIFTPTQITVPAGSISTGATYWLVDDDLVDGAQNVILTASAPGFTTATKTATVRDNELGKFVWSIAGPVVAGVPVSAQISAQTIDDDPLSFTGQIAISAAGRPLTPQVQNGAGTVSLRFFQAGSTVVTATAGTASGSSAAFDVVAAETGAFQWSALPTAILQNTPTNVQIKATDIYGNATSTFNGTASLKARTKVRESYQGNGSGIIATNALLNTANTQSRTQMFFYAAQVGAAGRINAISLNLASLPPRAFDDLTIRLMHIGNNFVQTGWVSTGWSTVRSGPWMPVTTGWVPLPLQTPFDYNGTDGLLVDISFANSAASAVYFCNESPSQYISSATKQASTSSTSFGPPTSWAGSSPASNNARTPQMRIEFGNVLMVTPATTSAFVDGAWSGAVSLDGSSAPQAYLEAESGVIHGGSANFEFGLQPLAAPVFTAEPAFTTGLTNILSWNTVSGAGDYFVQRATNAAFSPIEAESGWIPTSNHLFSGLNDDTIYYYRVKNRRAEDTTVESAWSGQVASTQDDNAPSITISHLNAQNEIQSRRSQITLRGTYTDPTSAGSVSCSATVPGSPSLMQNSFSLDGNAFGQWSTTIDMPTSGSATATLNATDAAGHSTQQTITLVRLTDANGDGLADEWQQSAGLLTAGLSADDLGPLGDPDGDGMSNLMELACGTAPLVAGGSSQVFSRQVIVPTGPVLPGTSNTNSVISFDRRRGAAIDFSFVPQSSTSLTSWSDVSSFTETVVPNPDGLTERVTWSMPDSSGFVIIIGGGLGGLIGPGGGVSTPTSKFFRARITVLPNP